MSDQLSLDKKMWLAGQLPEQVIVNQFESGTIFTWGEPYGFTHDNDHCVTDREWLFICHLVFLKQSSEIQWEVVKVIEVGFFDYWGPHQLIKLLSCDEVGITTALMRVLGEGKELK